MLQADVAIVGGGIVGLATAYQLSLAKPNAKIVVLEKEGKLASHQTGRNSGVIHSGIYYKPGSLRAQNCRQGKKELEKFCADYGVKFETCGKVIVAVEEKEFPGLQRIFERGQANGVDCALIDQARLKELEPHCAGIKAIHVPEAGIVDYPGVCQKLAELIVQNGLNEIRLNAKVEQIKRDGQRVRIVTSTEEIESQLVVNCAGLHCDRVSSLGGLPPQAKIVPFRGEYFEVIPEMHHLCRNLIYPVPDPNFPFLGVHFTRMVLGGVECGPNAVLAFAREGYGKLTINIKDLAESLSYPGFIKLAMRNWQTGFGEMWRSFSKQAFVRALQRLMPEIEAKHLHAAPSGVRAQALNRDGSLVDDFLILENDYMITVNNAPSPAATASLNIGRSISEQVTKRLS